MSDDVTTYADEHEGGQLRIAVAGEQVSLLPIPCRVVAELLGDPLAELSPAMVETIRGQMALDS